MTQIKPLEGMMTPRFADIATFFRLPVIKDLSNRGIINSNFKENILTPFF